MIRIVTMQHVQECPNIPSNGKIQKNENGADYRRSSHSVCNSSPVAKDCKREKSLFHSAHHWRKSGPENTRNNYSFHFLCVFHLPLTASLSFSTSDENQCQIQIRNADTRQIQDKLPFHFPPCLPFTSELLAFKYETQDRHSLGLPSLFSFKCWTFGTHVDPNICFS